MRTILWVLVAVVGAGTTGGFYLAAHPDQLAKIRGQIEATLHPKKTGGAPNSPTPPPAPETRSSTQQAGQETAPAAAKNDIRGLRIGMTAAEVTPLIGPCDLRDLDRYNNMYKTTVLHCDKPQEDTFYTVSFTSALTGSRAYNIRLGFCSTNTFAYLKNYIENQYRVSNPVHYTEGYHAVWDLTSEIQLDLDLSFGNTGRCGQRYDLTLLNKSRLERDKAAFKAQNEKVRNEAPPPPL